MSLREEIYHKIENARNFRQYIDSAEITEDIINVIEKRIDEMIKECYDKHENYPVGTQHWIICLKNVKERLR